MQLGLRDSNRWCALETVGRLDHRALRREILAEQGVESGFTVLPVPAPVQDPTVFKAVTNGRQVLFGFALYNSTGCLSPRADTAAEDVTELLFDLRHDRCGFFQFRFTPPQPSPVRNAAPAAASQPHRDREIPAAVASSVFQPYPEYRRSDAVDLQPLRHEWRAERFSPCAIIPLRVRWLFVWFRYADLFARGDVIGFNAARSRPGIDEFGCWNYAGGNGSADAAHFGNLYASGPVRVLRLRSASKTGSLLALRGTGVPARRLRLSGPRGEDIPLEVGDRGKPWAVQARIPPGVHGRLRLVGAGRRVEPGFVAIDLPPPRRKRAAFTLAVLYDSPMSIISNHYTPGRLQKEMRRWKELGLTRVHVQNYANWPSFWERPVHLWHRHHAATVRACGDFFAAVVRAAREAGLEAIGDHKVFDLGFNCWFVDPDGRSTVEDIESRHVPVIPEIAAHPEWTFQANPQWLRPAVFPVRAIRLFSETPLPSLDPGDLRILVSSDNRVYRPYAGTFTFSAKTVRRKHREWTPAGTVPLPGAAVNGCLELSGLSLQDPYAALQFGRDPWFLRHRGYMVAEVLGNDGAETGFTVATNGDSRNGFSFWKGWMGWNNHNEPLLDRRMFPGHDFGLVFREMPNMPTLLEPACEGAHGIWLERLRHSLDCGADGVAVRTYCHHNGMMQYLKYAFAPSVRAEYARRYGRAPRLSDADYVRIRRIRGEGFTAFMRAASAEARRRGRKFICILESGVEIPPERDLRMHLPLEWRRWITEGLLDEIRLKYFTAESRFVHEEVLPLARKHGLRVTVTSRCLHTGIGPRGVELARQTIRNAIDAGLDGYCLYEQQNLLDLNPLGRATFKGRVADWFSEARKAMEPCDPRHAIREPSKGGTA